MNNTETPLLFLKPQPPPRVFPQLTWVVGDLGDLGDF